MKVLIKGYYGYKNFGDEMILFSVLHRVEQNLNPKQIVISAGNKARMQERLKRHQNRYPQSLLPKIEILAKSGITDHFKNLLRIGQDWDFLVLGGGQVIDEERSFPHDGRNLPLLYKKYLNNGQFALIGGIGTQHKDGTPLLHKMLLERAKIVLLRESFSEGIAERTLSHEQTKKLKKTGELSLSLLAQAKKQRENTSNQRDPYVLINISPAVDFTLAVKKIKIFLKKFPKAHPIFFPAHQEEDLPFGLRLQEQIPGLDIIDWTGMELEQTLKLLYFAEAGIGQRLHFLFPLKYFAKEYEVLQMNHKLQVNLLELD